MLLLVECNKPLIACASTTPRCHDQVSSGKVSHREGTNARHQAGGSTHTTRAAQTWKLKMLCAAVHRARVIRLGLSTMLIVQQNRLPLGAMVTELRKSDNCGQC